MHPIRTIIKLVLALALFFTATTQSWAAVSGDFFSESPVFAMALPAGSIQWHPHFYYTSAEAQLFTATYEGLVSGHPLTQRPVAGVAESWDISSDKKNYTFKLRGNARYSNGDLVQAQDFRNAWISLLKKGDKAPFSSLLDPIQGARDFRLGKNKDEGSVGITAKDNRTLVLTLTQPTAHFLSVLSHQSLVPIHPELLKKDDWSTLEVIPGNGPFILSSRSRTALAFERNKLYWDSKNVSLHRIEVSLNDDVQGQTALFNNHKLQWLSSGADYEALTNRSAILITPQFATNFLFFNNRIPALQNAKVRRALTLLIDLPKLRDPAEYFVPSSRLVPEIPYYPTVKSLGEQNRTLALSLLEEAGYPQGKGLPELTIYLPTGKGSARIADLMTSAWADLQFTTVYKPETSDDYNNLLNSTNYAVGTLGWIGDYPDPLTFLDLFSGKGSLNIASYLDPAFDALLLESASQQGTERYKTLAACEEILLMDAVCIPLSHSPSINIIDLDQVDGWYENPFDIHPFKSIKPKSPKPPRNIAGL